MATWEMNESTAASVMHDSSGNGLDGSIGAEVVTGAVYDRAIGYRFARLIPNTPPAHPEHIVRVPNSSRLNPGSRPFAVEIRYRTTNPFGNVVQKGQAAANGGYWKFQAPQGDISCLFRGPQASNAVRSRSPLNDGRWHTVRCESWSDRVDMFIDGVFEGRNRGITGPIANDQPVYVGGKGDCDQVKVTCDYFGGDIDFVRVTAGG